MLILRTTAILHLDLPSTCIHRESEEGLAQLERERSLAKKDRRRSAMAEMFQEEEEARNEKETRRRKVETGMTSMTRAWRALLKCVICSVHGHQIWFPELEY